MVVPACCTVTMGAELTLSVIGTLSTVLDPPDGVSDNAPTVAPGVPPGVNVNGTTADPVFGSVTVPTLLNGGVVITL